MQFDVPFLPDNRYVQFLEEHEQSLYSVHYSLQQDIPDGRHSTGTIPVTELNRTLSPLTSVRKYALLNSRFHSPDTYLDKKHIQKILHILEALLAEQNIHGIVIIDFYLLIALSDASPEISSQLEAVPGVNTMLDSFERIQSWMQNISHTRFKTSAKLTLDRSLNRKMEMLEEVSASCKEQYPDIRLTLLANEGCLFRCPFKYSHDAHIAYANIETCINRTYEINSRLGCIRILSEHPGEILRSPFIRPEDQKYYTPYADVLKICGRTLEPDFLKTVIKAYIEGKFNGNLLSLLDTQDWQADRLSLANSEFSRDFLERLTTCDNNCSECGYCESLFKRVSRFTPGTIKDFRHPEPGE